MVVEIYAVLDTNEAPRKLKPSGSDEFYFYFPPPLPQFIVLFIVTKEVDEINFLFKVSVCIDNEIEDKYIGEMGGDRPSICWNGDWEPEEISYAKNALQSGRAMKLQVLKEVLPNPDDEVIAEPKTTEENEDELLRGSIAMCEDALDDIDEEKKKLINELFNGKSNGVLKSRKKSKSSTPKKPGRGRAKNDSPIIKRKSDDDPSPRKMSQKSLLRKFKVDDEIFDVLGSKPNNDNFEFIGEEEPEVPQQVVAGRIGGKRGSPFGALPKIPKKSYTDGMKKKENSLTPLSFTDILPTRNPSRRWGHAFCPLAIGNAIVIGGEGDKRQLNADSIWTLNVNDSTWTSQQSDNTSIPRRVGHSICYDKNTNVIYLYGGTKQDKWFSDVYTLDLSEWKWTKVDTIGKAPTRSYHSCTMDYDELLIFGGVFPTPAPNPDGCSNELHIFSTENKSWYTPIVSGDVPSGRSGHSACMLDRKLHIFGGWNAPECYNDMYVLDLGIMNFTKLDTVGTVPPPRTWHSSQLLADGRRFCIYGGFNGDKALDDLYIFSSLDNAWIHVFYPGLVCRAGQGVIQKVTEDEPLAADKLLVFGGGDNDGHFYNDLATLNLNLFQ